MRSANKIALLVVAFLLRPGIALGYPWPFDDGSGPYPIGGTFGEFREGGETPSGISGVHFHTGIDISTQTSANVRAIAGGTIGALCSTDCGDYPYVLVKSEGFAFNYMHVVPLKSSGTVRAGEIIGNVYTNTGWPTHVHLIYRNTLTGVYENGLLVPAPGPANYVDTSSPTVGALDVYRSSESVFGSPLDVSSPTVYSSFRVRANVYDRQSYGSPGTRTGIFSIGYQVTRLDTGQPVVTIPARQAYGAIPGNFISNPNYAYDSINSRNATFLYFANNLIQGESALDLTDQPDGVYKICVVAKDIKGNGGDLVRMIGAACQLVTVDRTKPEATMRDANGANLFDGGASSMTTVTVTSTDTFGVAQIAISGPTSESRIVSGPTATETFSGLTDGQYSAAVVDLAGNSSQTTFVIRTTPGTASFPNAGDNALPAVALSTNCIVIKSSGDPSGIASISFSGPDISSSTALQCPPQVAANVEFGPFCNLSSSQSSSTYTATIIDCAGNVLVSTQEVAQASPSDVGITLCSNGTCSFTQIAGATIAGSSVGVTYSAAPTVSGGTGGYPGLICGQIVSGLGVACADTPDGLTWNCQNCRTSCGGGSCSYNNSFGPFPTVSGSFSVGNSTPSIVTPVVTAVKLSVNIGSSGASRTINSYGATGATITVSIPELGQQNWVSSTTAGPGASQVGSIQTPLKAPQINCSQPMTAGQALAYKKVSLTLMGVGPCLAAASDFVLTSSGTISINYLVPGSLVVDTTTLALYRFDGVTWTNAAVTGGTVTISGSSIAVSGSFVRAGTYAALFQAHDSSAPITSLSFQLTSSATFDNTLCLSTDAFAVLTATDPLANGYETGVARTYYRIDAASPSTSYSIYTSSLPLPLGFHSLEFYSQDWAGNNEGVRRSTFLVTAGTIFKALPSLQVPGSLTAGLLSFGNKTDIQSRAENAFTLAVSSTDGSPMLMATSDGQIALGTWAPQATLESLPANAADPALQLRAGNASTATPSIQIALGYSGDVAMSHAIRSEHASGAAGNAVDFLLWTPAIGSTVTIGNLEALALQEVTIATASFHIHPATGTATAQVEVSDGGTIGAGTVHRAAAYAVSSRAIKTDIDYLSAKDQQRAYGDVLALKPATFRYKSDAPGTTRRGLIFEETPESIRAPGSRLSYDERLVNVELALKEASERVAKLKKRLQELEAGR